MAAGVAWPAVADAAVTISVPCPASAPGGGPAGLIAAINHANAHGGGTIDLAPGCTYRLGPSADNNANGLPVVKTPITIEGNGSTIARSSVAGTADFRIFEVDGPGNLTLNALTVSGGRAPTGGGILNTSGGTVTLDDSRVTNNVVAPIPGQLKLGGGGISNDNGVMVSINNSRVDHNQVVGPVGTLAVGGGLYENHGGLLRLNGSRVDHNKAEAPTTAQGGGIGVDFAGAPRTVALTSSQVDGNVVEATTSGAGVVAKGGGIGTNGTTLTLSSSRVVGNSVSAPGGTAFGGGIHSLTAKDPGVPDPDGRLGLTSSQVTGNTAAGHSVEGGAITNQAGAARITSSQVIGNAARSTGTGLGIPPARGGGIENLQAITLTSTQLSNNTLSTLMAAACGGGLFNAGSANLDLTTVTGNSAAGFPAHGGGIFTDHTVLAVFSLISGNVPDNLFDGPVSSCQS